MKTIFAIFAMLAVATVPTAAHANYLEQNHNHSHRVSRTASGVMDPSQPFSVGRSVYTNADAEAPVDNSFKTTGNTMTGSFSGSYTASGASAAVMPIDRPPVYSTNIPDFISNQQPAAAPMAPVTITGDDYFTTTYAAPTATISAQQPVQVQPATYGNDAAAYMPNPNPNNMLPR